jgi:hypothetical protein
MFAFYSPMAIVALAASDVKAGPQRVAAFPEHRYRREVDCPAVSSLGELQKAFIYDNLYAYSNRHG